ncbi:MAG: endonuclease/exonuclease/phosphatase family protein [Clostridia bacterium]|nr:endonuclease/exonuclease/phosphatase family protein [Clostridia bacterium]
MRLLKKLLSLILKLVLVAALICAVVFGFYLPQYLLDKDNYSAAAKEETDVITVVSANVRCLSPEDLFKKSWFYRAPLLIQTLKSAAPDIIGFQEVTPVHKQYLDKALRGFGSVLLYRDDSLIHESCPIYYSESKFDLIDKGGFWLSETPDVMSKGWGAAFNRVCSYVILAQKTDGKQLVVFNTHLDNVSEEARINGIKLVLQKIEQFGGMPSIIMGDFNTGENTETYRAAVSLFNDAKYQTEDTDSGATYQGYGQSLNDENLDYFMLSKTGIETLSYKVLRDTYDGVYPSDHFPIRLDMKLS